MSEKDQGKTSKFASLLQPREVSPEPESELAAPAPSRGSKLGRPATGKRSNPDYEQVSVYLRKDTHKAAKIALLQLDDERDVSELVEDLLAEWVRVHHTQR